MLAGLLSSVVWVCVAFAGLVFYGVASEAVQRPLDQLLRTALPEVIYRFGYQVPGTFVHESAHASIALLFGFKIVEFDVLGGRDEATLGHVRVMHTQTFVSQVGLFFCGLGPVLVGPLFAALLLPDRASLFEPSSPLWWLRMALFLPVTSGFRLSGADIDMSKGGATKGLPVLFGAALAVSVLDVFLRERLRRAIAAVFSSGVMWLSLVLVVKFLVSIPFALAQNTAPQTFGYAMPFVFLFAATRSSSNSRAGPSLPALPDMSFVSAAASALIDSPHSPLQEVAVFAAIAVALALVAFATQWVTLMPPPLLDRCLPASRRARGQLWQNSALLCLVAGLAVLTAAGELWRLRTLVSALCFVACWLVRWEEDVNADPLFWRTQHWVSERLHRVAVVPRAHRETVLAGRFAGGQIADHSALVVVAGCGSGEGFRQRWLRADCSRLRVCGLGTDSDQGS